MKKTYLYLHHQGFDFYFKNRELTREECYCPSCDEYDTLVGVFEDEVIFGNKLRQLFAEGYDLVPCDEYDRIKNTYINTKEKTINNPGRKPKI